MRTVHHLNIAFDAKSPTELVHFVRDHIAKLSADAQSRIHIKVNDLLAFVGIEGLQALHAQILRETGVDVVWMIDGKWNDIPSTVANYAKRLESLHVAYYTVNASGGPEMIRAAKQAAPRTKLLAITVLTSMKDEDVTAVYDSNRAGAILRLAKNALSAGADGLVCSPRDAQMIRAVFGEEFLLVTPNIHCEGTVRNDDQNQALSSTPSEAIGYGANDIVAGRPILNVENPSLVIMEMLDQMEKAPRKPLDGAFRFERLLYTEGWEDLFKYIGAIYYRPHNREYVRAASGFVLDGYINVGAAERDYRVIERAADELRHKISKAGIASDIVMGAQMGSIRLSATLARSLRITESIYTEKKGNDMLLLRHDMGADGLRGKKIILSEDVITKGSTIAKMIEIVRSGGGEVVAITCVVNRSNQDDFEGIPIFTCYSPPTFSMWWDEETLRKIRANGESAGKSEAEIEAEIQKTKEHYAPIPQGSVISEKPKNEWLRLVQSMRDTM